jgi:hypothetical protein
VLYIYMYVCIYDIHIYQSAKFKWLCSRLVCALVYRSVRVSIKNCTKPSLGIKSMNKVIKKIKHLVLIYIIAVSTFFEKVKYLLRKSLVLS